MPGPRSSDTSNRECCKQKKRRGTRAPRLPDGVSGSLSHLLGDARRRREQVGVSPLVLLDPRLVDDQHGVLRDGVDRGAREGTALELVVSALGNLSPAVDRLALLVLDRRQVAVVE